MRWVECDVRAHVPSCAMVDVSGRGRLEGRTGGLGGELSDPMGEAGHLAACGVRMQ
jgi:hypothetical protein